MDKTNQNKNDQVEKDSLPPKKVKNPVLQEILNEIENEKKDRVAFPFWGNRWGNWRNWGNWYNGW